MTLFGSTANDAAFNAWVTDNTTSSDRGRIESIISILPLISMLIVAGAFGMIVEAIGYKTVFLILGIFISLSGVLGLFLIKDSDTLEKNGTLRDMLYGFKPSSVKSNLPFYVNLLIMCIYGIACQIFMPYIIIYMKSYLNFSVVEYSVIFGAVILIGAVINLFLGKLSDKISKSRALYAAAVILALGLLLMYFSKGVSHRATLILFGASAFVMITGYIFVSALSGATARDNTPKGEVGKLQGVRMIFAVLIPMLAGPAIGNAINRARNIKLENPGADAMTTEFVPAPEIFLAAAIVTLLIIAIVPILERVQKYRKNKENNNELP
jgi:MFS family permease